ncbi:DUF1801 domain-containing protein [Polaromonas sp.]|uniref:DUF1801 domain-containing protein n=1 Tax=Polaromonas sp. TaxID=1869339 RepID=UPI003265EB89
MKMILTSATTPDEYLQCLSGWQQAYAEALCSVVRATAPAAEEHLKWGHIVYFLNGPVLLIRAEPTRVLFGFWRGKRLRHVESRLKPGGKYDMATLELREGTPLQQGTVVRLVEEAVALNRSLGNPAVPSAPGAERAA